MCGPRLGRPQVSGQSKNPRAQFQTLADTAHVLLSPKMVCAACYHGPLLGLLASPEPLASPQLAFCIPSKIPQIATTCAFLDGFPKLSRISRFRNLVESMGSLLESQKEILLSLSKALENI